MPASVKRKRTERAHRYRVIAQQLEFHLATRSMGEDVERIVEKARDSLLDAASLLEGRTDPSPTTSVESPPTAVHATEDAGLGEEEKKLVNE